MHGNFVNEVDYAGNQFQRRLVLEKCYIAMCILGGFRADYVFWYRHLFVDLNSDKINIISFITSRNYKFIGIDCFLKNMAFQDCL